MSQSQQKKRQPSTNITPIDPKGRAARVAGAQSAHLIWVAAEIAEIKQWALVVAKQAELAPLLAEHQRLNDIRIKARETMTALL